MSTLSREVQPFGRHKVAAPSALESGEPFAVAGYPTMILNQMRPAASGDRVCGVSTGTFEFPKASATTGNSGDTAYWHEANKLVVTSSGAGIITLGKFRGAAVNGKTVCNVELNGV
jgi:predicted RecA/RadA family phage recombinase